MGGWVGWPLFSFCKNKSHKLNITKDEQGKQRNLPNCWESCLHFSLDSLFSSGSVGIGFLSVNGLVFDTVDNTPNPNIITGELKPPICPSILTKANRLLTKFSKQFEKTQTN